MPNDLQEWLALAIVIAIAGFASRRFLAKRKAKACGDCAASGCGIKNNSPGDDEVRILAKPEVSFSKRSPDSD